MSVVAERFGKTGIFFIKKHFKNARKNVPIVKNEKTNVHPAIKIVVKMAGK